MKSFRHGAGIRASRPVLASAAGAAIALIASAAHAQVNSVNLQFGGVGNTVADTGFDGAYTFNPSGIALVDGTLVILTLPGDTFGNYENEPDSAQNFFYSNMNVGARTVLEAKVNAININQNFHGGGIWIGTDQDHYLRLGIIHNSFEGGVAVEALRENEDRWRGPGDIYPNRPGFDIESRYLNINESAAAGNVDNAVLRIIRDGTSVAGYISLDDGATFTRIGGDTYSFNALAVDATTLSIDNRTAADPNNADRTSHTVETDRGGFKIGAYALGGGTSQAAIQFDYVVAQTGTPTWVGGTGGEWTGDANWTAGLLAPVNIESTALLPAAASSRNITVSSDIVATKLRFESPAGDTISGTGEVRFDWFYFPTHPEYYNTGPGTVTVTAGHHTISAPALTAHTHQFDIAAGGSLTLSDLRPSPVDNGDAGIRKLGEGTLRVNVLNTPNIDIQAGKLAVLHGATPTVSRIRTLNLSGGGALDLADNALVLDYADGTVTLADVRARLQSGSAGGANDGPGIHSSTAAHSNFAVGYAEASTLAAIPSLFGDTDDDTILFRYTYKGDTDLNGAVNFEDLLSLAQNYDISGSGKTWVDGDSNYDGVVNFDDLLGLAQNYGAGALSTTEAASLGADFLADWTLAQSLVPEPTAILGLGAIALIGRRRR